jgi:hypothetical protein
MVPKCHFFVVGYYRKHTSCRSIRSLNMLTVLIIICSGKTKSIVFYSRLEKFQVVLFVAASSR